MNLPDGSVEAVFEGDEAAVERMVAWCRQGPPSARVAGVVVNRGEYRGEFAYFAIRRRQG
jgi:acylphosphatase